MSIETESRAYGNTGAFFVDAREGVFRYPVNGGNYNQSERILAIFQSNQPNSLELSFVDTEEYHNYVTIYTIPPYSLHADATFNGR